MSAWEKVKVAIVRRKLLSNRIPEDCKNPLEEWMAIKAMETFKKHPEFRKALGVNKLDEVGPEEFQEYQLFRVREQMRYTQENSIFYRDYFRKAGVSPEDIRSYDDLVRIPMTTPEQMAAEPMHFLCVSVTKTERAFSTTGTTGVRKRVFYTREDLLAKIDIISSALMNVGMKKGDVLHIMFPTVGAWDPSLMMAGACLVAGFGSSSSSSVDIEEQMKTIVDNNSTFIIGLPSFIYRVTVLAGEKVDLKSMGIKKIISAAEPLSEAMRNTLQNAWGCPVLDVWGMTEFGLACAVECDQRVGLHTDEANLLFEIIDPDTGQHLPYGEKGELIVTSLTAEATPLIRYRTRDISALYPPGCDCGTRFNHRIAKPSGRMDLMTKIGLGQKVYPLLFDEAVLRFPEIISYHVIIDRAGYKDRLTFCLESLDQSDILKEKVLDALLSIPEIEYSINEELLEMPRVLFRPPGSEDYTSKAKIIIDKRGNYD
ncbi:MAG: phenylacetate-CoA ligase [Candidatus Methanomethylophilaceae archaeon]|nr:phenylacetate-CoA ligase [Candidatus Methanomethylophilaceae archaeon]MDI3542301.1 phenylacetate-CoA ligase [Candidatus Methanomethylophilaceae archaeon]